MNQALSPTSFTMPSHGRPSLGVGCAPRLTPLSAWSTHEEVASHRRVRSLLTLFALYAGALLLVATVSDGADLGCILGGIAGHVLYAARRIANGWRDAASLEAAKARALLTYRRRLA